MSSRRRFFGMLSGIAAGLIAPRGAQADAKVRKAPARTPTPVSGGWVARLLPSPAGGKIFSPATYSSGGGKHCTTLYCPLTKKLYVFGGDYSGYSEIKGLGGDNYRNDIWSYECLTDKWKLEQGSDVPDGRIMPWHPDWGCFAWDSKRKVFWFSAGGSCGAFLGSGVFNVTEINGLTLSYAGGVIMPDPFVIPKGSWPVPDNKKSYIEYDDATNTSSVNQTGFTLGRYPLYEVISANGLAKATNKRPYWLMWGSPTDKVDRRHYADPHHLIALDPNTMKWSDPGLATFAEQLPPKSTNMGNGRILTPLRKFKGMVYDEQGDQLVLLGNGSAVHYSFTRNQWSSHPVTENAQLEQDRHVLVGRKIYAVSPRDRADTLKSYGWTYDVDAHVQTRMNEVPHQVIPSPVTSGPCKGGQLAGSSGEDVDLKYDPKRDVIWYCEVLAPCQNPYGYGESGSFVNMHCWHYKEDRWETIPIPYDPANRPHGLMWGFDPNADMFMMWGQNAPTGDPVHKQPYVYVWTPSLGAAPATNPTPTIGTIAVLVRAQYQSNPAPTMGTILLPLVGKPPVEYGVRLGPAAITLAWNGAAFDYSTGTMYIPVPGGHADWYPNESYAIQVPNGRWRKLHGLTPFPPTGTGYDPVSRKSITASVYDDGQPCSRHIYGGTQWLPTQKRIWLMSGSRWSPDGSYDTYSGWLDPVTGFWTRKADVPRGYNGICSAYDPNRGQVVWGRNGTGSVYIYDPAADTHTVYPRAANDPAAGSGPQVSFQIDPVGDYLYAIKIGGFNFNASYAGAILRMKLGQTTPQKWEIVPVTGNTGVVFGINPGFEYDPERHAFVLWGVEDAGAVTILPLDTFVARREILPVTPPILQTRNGVWGRFRRYAPNKYCLMVGASHPMQFFTLS